MRVRLWRETRAEERKLRYTSSVEMRQIGAIFKIRLQGGSRARQLLRLDTDMATLKINRRHQSRVRVQPSAIGYEVQVYGQTVFRSPSQGEAERLAKDLTRALG